VSRHPCSRTDDCRRSRAAVPALLLIIVFIAAAPGCTGQPADSDGPRAIPVATQQVVIADITLVARVAGKVVPREDITVSANIAGRVAEVRVTEGDAVQAGQVLLTLEARELAAQVRQAEAAVAAARANLAGLQNGPRPQELEQAEAQADQARANLESARKDFARMESLFEQGAISEQQYEGVRLKLDVAQAQYDMAEQSLSLAQAGARQESVAAARAQLQQAEAARELARLQLEHAEVTAPTAGLVAAAYADRGELVSPGVPLVRLVDIDEVFVEALVSESLVTTVGPGETVPVAIGGSGAAATGVVAGTSPAADERTGTFLVRVGLANPDHAYLAGMVAELRLPESRRTGVAAVPQAAVLERGNSRYVFVVDAAGTARERAVEVGLSDGGTMEIVSGLQVGEQVVVQGQHYLKDGDPVAVVGSEAQ